jgi:hypothetical protein
MFRGSCSGLQLVPVGEGAQTQLIYSERDSLMVEVDIVLWWK